MTEAEIISIVRSSQSEKRFLHTIGCAEMAESLATRWGADVVLARRAAYLHDITKEMPYCEQLKLVDKFSIMLSRTQRSEKIIHAFSAALLAEHEFKECEAVCGAIRWHTTARENMTELEKIIWLSDLIEKRRSFPGVSEIRELAFKDLGAALIRAFDTTLAFLLEKECEIDINMIKARNFEIAMRKDRLYK